MSSKVNQEAADERENHKRKIPLKIISQKRYEESKKKYCEQFRRDIEEMASLQPYALAGVRLQRMFCVGLRIPELESMLSPTEKRVVEKILDTPLVY